MRVYTYILFAATLLSSCSTAEISPVAAETPVVESKPLTADMVSLDLSEHLTDASIMVPTKKTRGVDPTVTMDAYSGMLSVMAGKGFHMTLREEPLSLSDLKAESDTDIMWQTTIVEEDAQSMILKRSLPDGSMAHYQMAAVVNLNTANVVLRSDAMSEFTIKDAQRMRDSAITLKSKSELTAHNQTN